MKKKYAKADIVWKDTGDFIDGVIFKLSPDVDPNEDGCIFYYSDGEEELLSLTKEGMEDFIILKDSIEYLEKI